MRANDVTNPNRILSASSRDSLPSLLASQTLLASAQLGHISYLCLLCPADKSFLNRVAATAQQFATQHFCAFHCIFISCLFIRACPSRRKRLP